mgnify:CR=1 FL=1
MIIVPDLTTEHLLLRPIGPGGADYLIGIHRASSRMVFDDVDSWDEDSTFTDYILESLQRNATGWLLLHAKTQIKLGALYFVDILEGITCNFHPVSDIGALKDAVPTDAHGHRLRTMDEAIKTAFPWCAEAWGLQRIGGAFGSHNVPSLKLCERVGMRKEGVVRNGVKIKGKPVDLVIYGLLREEVDAWGNLAHSVA